MLKHALVCCAVLTLIAAPAHAIDAHKHANKHAATFAPHKALYNIKLASVRNGSQVLNISGQMFYEWQAGCDAWTTNHRFNMLYEYADNAPMRLTSTFTSYESFDGRELNFTSQRKKNGALFEEIRGKATIDEDKTGKATYTIPADLTYDLPKGTLFPVGHSIALAEQIKQGKKFYNATLFDGSDEEGPVAVNTFFAKPALKTVAQQKAEQKASPSVNSANIDKTLLASPAHNVRLAFFALNGENSDEATSDYEMDMAFHKNSLISNMRIEYDDFAVSQELVALEPLEAPSLEGCKER